MRDVLFLAHRIPYPPDKGDKIRAWNVLRHLASRHRVHLATFIDDPHDVQHVDVLAKICANVVWRPLSSRFAKLRSLTGLLYDAPLTQGYFADTRLRNAINRIIEQHRPSLFYVFSSAMAPYIRRDQAERLIIDMVDVDSEKWRQYAAESTGLRRAVYAREHRTLLALERRTAAEADAILFVSRAEAELFAKLAPELAGRTKAIRNGVDINYFDPSVDYPNPFGDQTALVFTGLMNYRPNIDAVAWFVEHVMPRLRLCGVRPCLWVVGSNPTRDVRALAAADIFVTGRVPDVRPYLRHARVVIAPLRIARGIQNKVLEAMAMGAPVVATPQAREGLEECCENELATAATPAEFVNKIRSLMEGGGTEIGTRARARVVRDFRWEKSLAVLDDLVDDSGLEVRDQDRLVSLRVAATSRIEMGHA